MSKAAFSVQVSVSETGRRRPEYSVNTDLNGEITLGDLLQFTKSSLIIISDEVLKEEQANGFDKEPVLAVDGRVGKPVAAVHPLGQIEFTSRQSATNILVEAYTALLYRSKVKTGRYKDSHYVFLNGKQVATNLSSLESWIASNPEIKDKDTLRIVNIQPYARKLERLGITAQRSNQTRRNVKSRKGGSARVTVVVPNGTYHLTTRAIRSKYKRNSIIYFAFLPGSSLGLTGTFQKGRRGKNSAGRPYLYPSIVISVQGRGTV